MGKKKQKVTTVKTFSLLPILILLLIFWGIRFVSDQSAMNISRKNDANYENKLISDNYAFKGDLDYKKMIIQSAGKYSLPELEFVMGPQELKQYIEKYDNTPKAYAYGQANPTTGTYIREGKLRANLNIHSSLTDGSIDVKEILNQAAAYADILAEKNPKEKYIIAITDINSMDNAKIIINTIQADPERFQNLKVVFGIEIPTVLEANDNIDETSRVSILALCINPFDKELKKVFPSGLSGSYDTIEHNYDETVELLNSQRYLIYGIAQPLKELHLISNSFKYITNLLAYYSVKNPGFKFVEAYYDPYTYTNSTVITLLINEANKLNIHKIGSLEAYSEDIFEAN